MARSVKELRDIICTSRLKYDADDELKNLTLSSPDSGLGSAVRDPENNNKIINISKIEKPKHLTNSTFSKRNINTKSKTTNNRNKGSNFSATKPNPFHPFNTELENALTYLDMVMVTGWLEGSKEKMDGLSRWMSNDDNFCNFCYYWLSSLTAKKRIQMLKSQLDSLMEEVKTAFSSSPQPINNHLILNSILHEFQPLQNHHKTTTNNPHHTTNNPHHTTNNHTTNNPHHTTNNHTTNNYNLSYLLALTSQDHSKSREVLSDMKYHSQVKQHVQGILALRAYGLVKIWSGVVDSFKKEQKAKQRPFCIGRLRKNGNKNKEENTGMDVKKVNDSKYDDVIMGDVMSCDNRLQRKDDDVEEDYNDVDNKINGNDDKNKDKDDDNKDDDEGDEGDEGDDDDDDDDDGRAVLRRDENKVDVDRLMCAISHNHTAVVSYLIEEGRVGLDHLDSSNKSLLLHAVVLNRPSVLQWLVDEAEKKGPKFASALLQQAGDSGNTALHACVNTQNEACLKILLSSPFINPNHPNPLCANATPLHLAIMHDKTRLVCMLLEGGADARRGMHALTMTQITCTFKPSSDIIALLKEY